MEQLGFEQLKGFVHIKTSFLSFSEYLAWTMENCGIVPQMQELNEWK